jgi:hypothetical protein
MDLAPTPSASTVGARPGAFGASAETAATINSDAATRPRPVPRGLEWKVMPLVMVNSWPQAGLNLRSV